MYWPISLKRLNQNKAQRGGNRLTGVSTGQGGGGAPHGAKRPHLRIIVYISNKTREDQPLNQYG